MNFPGVSRHIIWNNLRPDLKEDLAHLVQDIKRRICGIASAGSPIALSECASDSIPRAKASNLVAAKLPATPVVVIQAAVDAA